MFNSIPDTTEEFWKKIQSNLGCEVRAYALAQYSRSAQRRGNKNALWGLLYISERGVHFYRFAQQSWMGSLMNRAPSEEFSLTLWFENITAWSAPKKLSFFKTLFATNNAWLAVRGQLTTLPALVQLEHEEKKAPEKISTHYFALDLRKHDIIHALSTYVASKRVSDDETLS